MDTPKPWTQLATTTLVDRWWMTLRQDRVRLPDGEGWLPTPQVHPTWP